MSTPPNEELALHELSVLSHEFSIPKTDIIFVFIASRFTEAAIIENQVNRFKSIMEKLSHSPMDVIAAAEWLAFRYPTEIKPRFSVLLKQLYDADLVDEDSIIAWSKYSFDADTFTSQDMYDAYSTLLAFAQPFIYFLENAEEETDDDS